MQVEGARSEMGVGWATVGGGGGGVMGGAEVCGEDKLPTDPSSSPPA